MLAISVTSVLVFQIKYYVCLPFTAGKKVTDYGDLELGDVEKDAPWKLVKYPLTVGYANQKVSLKWDKATFSHFIK